jgi:hypothetical protein
MPGVLYALAGYLLLALVVTFPLVLSFGRSLSDPVDPLLNAWILAWEHQALLHFPNEFLDANIFYPHKGTLLYSVGSFAVAIPSEASYRKHDCVP